MQEASLTEFSGIAGRVVQKSVSGASLITGIVLSVILFAGTWGFIYAGTPNAATPFSQVLFALAMSRFALNGSYGEWSGSIFSSTGGDFMAVLQVAGRYLALTSLWLIPTMVFGSVDEQALGMMMQTGAGMGTLVGSLGIYIFGMTVTPPVFLIIATAATGISDVVSPAHWRHTFSGRLGDLFVIFVVYTGGVCMVLLLCVPVVLIGFSGGMVSGFISAGTSFCLLLGISASLLGRLCGFFASGDVRRTAPLRAEYVEINSSNPLLGHAPEPVVEVAPPPLSIPVYGAALRPDLAATGDPATPFAPLPVTGGAAPEQEHAEPALPQVPDPERQARAAMQRFDQDPDGAIKQLEPLHRRCAPDPHILQALTRLTWRAGKHGAALTLANEAIPVCFERGHPDLVAEMFREMRSRMDSLELTMEQMLVVGAALIKLDDMAAAAKAYTAVIGADSGEIRAVKGLLQVADTILDEKNKPQAALKVYRYLLKHCADSPLAEFMRRGVESAKHKLGI